MRLRVRTHLFAIITVVLSLFVQSSLYGAEEIGPTKNFFKIDEIQIQGLKKVEPEAVLEKIGAQKGMMLDNYLVKRDLEKIYALKYFETVEAYQDVVKGKNVLIYKVIEKPIITKIIYEGNDELSEDDLKSSVKSREYAILDVNTIKSDVAAIQKAYEEKGYYLSNVTYELRRINAENVDVVFKIREFDKVRVKKVIFLGNKAFSDKELKEIMETREEGLFSFMSGSGNFKEFNFNTDIERLKYFYKTKGYLQVNVGTPQITVSEDKKWVFITIDVTEGPQFSVNDISFVGELLFPEDELRDSIQLKTGDTYSEELLRLDIQNLTEKYQDEGYAFVNVLRTLRVVPGENKVDIEFSFEKGKIAYFGKITVKGNTKTRDKVIRRELKIREGERFTGSGLRLSKENVNRLGFFEPGSVIFNTITPRGSDDVLDVEINVKERNTGQISLGAGYSTATGAFMQASIAQNNFRGLGQNLSFSLSISDTNQTFNLGFTEPYLFDTKWTAGFDIFRTKNETSDSFSYKKEGFDIRVGYPIFDYTRLFLTYKLEDTTISAVNDPTIDPVIENGIASSIKVTLLHDERDNRMEPTKGWYASLSSEYTGLGGDKKYLKNDTDLRYYYRVWGDLILRSRLYAGKMEYVDSYPIPRSEKFTLGGARNLRGFDYEAVGPLKTVPDNNGVLRTFNEGSLVAGFTQIELEHPLAREAGLKWVVFFDAGDAAKFEDFDTKMDYGFGFRWFSPIGILRFEFGYPINPGPKDSGSQFHFDIGQLF